MKIAFFITLASSLLLGVSAAEPVYSWDFNQKTLNPKLYGSELRDNALVCGEKHSNCVAGFKNYFHSHPIGKEKVER